MVGDALSGDRTIGLVLLKPGYEAEYHGRPEIYALGCSGVIVENEPLDDGRYNILVLGQSRFRVIGEREGEPYRLALVEELSDPEVDSSSLGVLRDRLLDSLGRLSRRGLVLDLQGEVPLAVLVNGLAQGLDLAPVEKLVLLGCDTLEERARRLVELLDFHALERTAGRTGKPH